MYTGLLLLAFSLNSPALAEEPAPSPPLVLPATPASPADSPPLPPGLRAYSLSLATGRVVIGAAPIVAYEPSMKLLGFPEEHDNPSARLMARLFGVRDIGLGVLVASSQRDRRALRRAFALNIAMDLGDAAMIAAPLIADQGIDRAAGTSLAFALTGAALWTAGWIWIEAAR